MKKRFPAVLAVIAALLAVSCGPQSPSSRISMRPDVYGRLSERDKQLVRNGEIAEGMGQDAVELAWGKPSAEVDGLRYGRRVLRWDYHGSKPVMNNAFFGGYESGSYGRYSYSGIGAGIAPEVALVPYREATVWFVDGRVDEWERAR